jgi:hypothetical protein
VTVRLYFDEDSSRHALVRELRSRGADIVTAAEAGMLGKDDEEQLGWASQNDRALYSYNRADFCALHAQWMNRGRSHAGIVVARQDFSVGEQMRRLLRLIASVTAEEMRDRLEFLTTSASG